MKNTAAAPSAEKGESNSERVRRYEGTPPDGDMNHGFVISSWTPMETPLDTPKQVDLFRRTVNLESDLFFMVAAQNIF